MADALTAHQPVDATPPSNSSPRRTQRMCDAACEEALEKIEMVTLPSGLQYKEITAGTGVRPPKGFQVRWGGSADASRAAVQSRAMGR